MQQIIVIFNNYVSIKIATLWIMQFLLIFLYFLTTANAQSVELAVGEWPPFVTSKTHGHGKIPEKLDKVFNQMGIKPSYKFFPWSRAFKQVETGQMLLSIGWIKNKEREQLVEFSSKPFFQVNIVFYHLKNRKIKFESFKDLRGLKIGLTREYAQPEAFSKAIDELNLTIEFASSDELNFRKLLSGRIDVFAVDRDVAQSLITSMFDPIERDFFVQHPKLVGSEKLWLIGTKNNARASELIKSFDSFLP